MSDKLIQVLWAKMSRTYGHQFRSSFGESDDGTWADTLSDLSPEQFSSGYKIAVQEFTDWPPTLPKFRELCLRSTAVEIPIFEDVYQAMFSHDWFHPIVNEVYSRLGSWNFSNMSDRQCRVSSKNIYDDISRWISEGTYEFKKPASKSHQLEDKTKIEAEKPAVMTHAEAMKKMRDIPGVCL